MNKWQKIEEAVTASHEMSPSRFESWLTELCAGDGELRSEIASLLSYRSVSESFLEGDLAPYAAGLLADEPKGLGGETFGNYRILRELGRGGMGAVFLVERIDGQFDRHAALKIVRQSLADREMIDNFRRERQILARLSHPNIARLFDGGVSERGEPYLVMEYIEGATLGHFTAALDIRSKLRIFRKICGAVAFAHRNLIVHRDLKPSNILVTSDGEPKLLDFGVAKILSGSTANEDQTQTGLRAITPAFASPEQLRGDTVTTATDIYSLGKILAALVGSPAADGNALSTDLRAIIQTAMREEPELRYGSVEAFAEDVENYLNGDPVRARPNTFQYRVSKLLRRHKYGAMAAGLIFLILAAGIGSTLMQARETERQRMKAEMVNTFLTRMLQYSNPVYKSMQKAGADLTINDVLDEAAARLDQGEFDDEPEVKAELSRTIGLTYWAQNQYKTASPYVQQYSDLTAALFGSDHPHSHEAQGYVAAILFVNGNMAEAERIFREVLPPLRVETARREIAAESMADLLNTFGYLRRTQGDSAEAEALFRESLALGPMIASENLAYVQGTTRATLASTLADQGRFDEAVATAEVAVSELREYTLAQTPTLGFNLTVLGGFLVELGRYDEAHSLLREAEGIFRLNLSPTALWLGDNLRNQAVLSYSRGRYKEAIDLADEVLSIYSSFGEHYDHYPTPLIVKGLSLAKLGQPDDGEKLLRKAVEIRRAELPGDHYWVWQAASALGECLALQGKQAEAESLLSESYEGLRLSQGDNNPRTQLALGRLVAFRNRLNP